MVFTQFLEKSPKALKSWTTFHKEQRWSRLRSSKKPSKNLALTRKVFYRTSMAQLHFAEPSLCSRLDTTALVWPKLSRRLWRDSDTFRPLCAHLYAFLFYWDQHMDAWPISRNPPQKQKSSHGDLAALSRSQSPQSLLNALPNFWHFRWTFWFHFWRRHSCGGRRYVDTHSHHFAVCVLHLDGTDYGSNRPQEESSLFRLNVKGAWLSGKITRILGHYGRS